MSIVWHPVVITSPRRQSTIDRTLDSLAAAGWPRVTVYSDRERIGCYQAWLAALRATLDRLPEINGDLVLICEDDCLFSANLRSYLETNPQMIWDDPAIVSLYTSSYNHQADRVGWHVVPTPDGKPIRTYGACAVVVPVYLLPELALNPTRPDSRDGTDHNIGLFCRRENVPYLCHSPSFVRHIGVETTLTEAGIERYRKEAAWITDAAKLLETA